MADLATLSQVRMACNIPAADTTQDAELQLFLSAATAVVENITGPIVSRSVTETHDGGAGTRTTLVLRQRPLLSIQSVTEYVGLTANSLVQAATPAASTAFSYTVDMETATLTRRLSSGQSFAWAWGDQNVTITYTAGFATVPLNIVLATLEQVRHMYQTTQLGGRPSFGGTGDGGYQTGYGYGIPNSVREYLQANQRIPGIA